MRNLLLPIAVVFGTLGAPVWSRDLPDVRDLLGEWVRTHGDSDSPLSVESNGGKLTIKNDLDGEGYQCTITTQHIDSKQKTARAICQ
jgi:hypothetical protein